MAMNSGKNALITAAAMIAAAACVCAAVYIGSGSSDGNGNAGGAASAVQAQAAADGGSAAQAGTAGTDAAEGKTGYTIPEDKLPSRTFKAVMESDSELKGLVEKSISAAAVLNTDEETNPVRSLDELYEFLDYSVTCMPWNILPDERYGSFATKCDQSILYVYWLLDQPLEELKDRDLFYPSVEYLEPVYAWLTDYNNTWKDYLDTEDSWKEEYYQMLFTDPTWNLDKGWYESPDNWKSFNDFFARRLSSDDARPIADPDDDSVVIAPADSLPQGTWQISEEGTFYADPIKREDGVVIKDSTFISVDQLIGEEGAEFAENFYGGTLTHTYLNYDDYHRYHFPVSGTVKAVYVVPYANAVGGVVYWDAETELYVLESNSLSWQSCETRGCVIIDTEEYGLVAVIPVGMGQVSSVNFEDSVKVGAKVKKGDPLGYFLFGGSDCVMLFEKQAGFELTAEAGATGGYSSGYAHVMCRGEYGKLHGSDWTAAAPSGPKPAEAATAKANAMMYDLLDFEDETEKENALRGLIEAPESIQIYREDGTLAWSVDAFDYVDKNEKAPDTFNPSLWRNTLYNSYAGLFEVCDGIYQVRGYDMSNMTFIRSDSGWIVFDVLMGTEDAAEALKLMESHFGKIDIKAVLYSHSHIDHYGGAEGIMSREDAADSSLSLKDQLASGKIAVLAPEGFLQHAVSENIYAGTAMSRRAQYQYGSLLDKGTEGGSAIGIGLGQSRGSVSLIAPTYEICGNEKLTIDGVDIEFQLTPGTEAPAEMNAYFPQYKALWMAENCTGTMHNLYTLRGAAVRDGSAWAKYILEAEQTFADKTDVVFQSHNWPHWGTDTIKKYLEDTASVYKFINDQTLHYINLGYTANEIADMIELPEELEKVWYTRQYYGTLKHNAKAVYQKYMGWYDANPVDLDPLTPTETASKLVEYLGDTEAVLEKARKDFENGEYQWVAQITRELVYADPSDQAARELCADALEQLGYQAESGTWRSAYLMGAYELRNGNQAANVIGSTGLNNMMQAMTMDMLLDYIAIRTDALEAQKDDVKINLIITDTDEKFYVERRNGVLLSYSGENRDGAELTVTCKKLQLLALLIGNNTIKPEQLNGDSEALTRLFKYCSVFTPAFNIIEP